MSNEINPTDLTKVLKTIAKAVRNVSRQRRTLKKHVKSKTPEIAQIKDASQDFIVADLNVIVDACKHVAANFSDTDAIASEIVNKVATKKVKEKKPA
ncbi:hypothetical protein UFOVP201_44 [uncultured Caudovirales phage]|uniref:Uncharacterized protein n=1 Tax=uncultured Caudovirales phage TaxID=2100421 RepID=A0A6J7WMU6_9CAUD|nr:hypothetical protein UFOVP201_44 [uncultured Caudovirales phage]